MLTIQKKEKFKNACQTIFWQTSVFIITIFTNRGKKSRATVSTKRNCFAFDGGRKQRYIVAGSRSSVSSDSSCLGLQYINHKFNNNWTGKQMSSLQTFRLFFYFSDRPFVCQVPASLFCRFVSKFSSIYTPSVFENHNLQGLVSQDFRSSFFQELVSWLSWCCHLGYFFPQTYCDNDDLLQ